MAKYICVNCGNLSDVNKNLDAVNQNIWNIVKTVLYIAVFIFLLFIPIIGWIIDIYLLFQKVDKKKNDICPACKSENSIIPIDTPKGQEMYAKYYNKEANQSAAQ